jgi:hypothetical protein
VLDPTDVAIYVCLVSGVYFPLFYFQSVSGNAWATAVANLGIVFVQLAVSAIGVWRCYLANGGQAGHRFAERFIALGWVVGVRFALLAASILVALFVFGVALEPPWMEVSMVLLKAIYFWRVWTHISWVVQHAENAP